MKLRKVFYTGFVLSGDIRVLQEFVQRQFVGCHVLKFGIINSHLSFLISIRRAIYYSHGRDGADLLGSVSFVHRHLR